MDIKQKIEEIVKKVMSDKTIADKFEKDPAKTIEELVGVDLPDDQVNQIVTAVKAKIGINGAANLLGGLGLFGKKE